MNTNIELISDQTNCPVVRMPGRRFPGIVLQGDSLRILLDSVREIRQLSESGQKEDLDAATNALEDLLAGYVASYEDAMKRAGLKLPYG